MNRNCRVEASLFENFHVPNNGGVFCVDSIGFDITCCFFTGNSCGKQGGCFYCTKANLNLKKSNFFSCWSQAYENHVFGNVGYVSEYSVNIDNINMLLCGKSSTECSDSALYFQNGLISPFNINATYNYGRWGCSSFTVRYTVNDESMGKFINVIDGRDESMLQFTGATFKVENANLINCSECIGVIIYATDNSKISLKNIIIWNTGDRVILNPTEYFNIDGCFCDREFPPLIKTEQCSSIFIYINMNCAKIETKCNCYSIVNSNFKYLLFIIILC